MKIQTSKRDGICIITLIGLPPVPENLKPGDKLPDLAFVLNEQQMLDLANGKTVETGN